MSLDLVLFMTIASILFIAIQIAIPRGDIGTAVPYDGCGVIHFSANATPKTELALSAHLIEVQSNILPNEEFVFDQNGR